MNEAPLETWMSREFLERNLLAGGSGNENIPYLLRVVAVLAFQTHNEIKLLLFLHHLGGHAAPDGRLNQGIDVLNVQSVAGNSGAVDVDDQARLPEFLHQGHLADAAYPFQDLFYRLAFLFQGIQIGSRRL